MDDKTITTATVTAADETHVDTDEVSETDPSIPNNALPEFSTSTTKEASRSCSFDGTPNDLEKQPQVDFIRNVSTDLLATILCSNSSATVVDHHPSEGATALVVPNVQSKEVSDYSVAVTFAATPSSDDGEFGNRKRRLTIASSVDSTEAFIVDVVDALPMESTPRSGEIVSDVNDESNVNDDDAGSSLLPNSSEDTQQPSNKVLSADPDHKKGQSKSTNILSLPNDSLHCIASFLTPTEWANFGQCDRGTNRICCNVFRRVRMHGFKCATEVVTAWKLNQHADAKELCALYVSAGVPIYPHSLGHSYHTLIWRMCVEAKELRRQQPQPQPTSSDNHNDDGEENEQEPAPIDAFFYDREDSRSSEESNATSRVSHENFQNATYLEEKAQYMLNGKEDEADVDQITQRLRRQMSIRHPPRIPPPQQQQQQHHQPDRFPLPHPRWNDLVMDRPETTANRPALVRSNSFSKVLDRSPKTSMMIHRHLLDQHLLGKGSVNDGRGKMVTPPLSLAADFFHPCLSIRGYHHQAHQILTHGNTRHDNSLQTSPTSSMGAGDIVSSNDVPIPLLGNRLEPSMQADEMEDDALMVDLHRATSSELYSDDSDDETDGNAIRPRPFLVDAGPHVGNVTEGRTLVAPPFPIMDPAQGDTFSPRDRRLVETCRYGPYDILNHVDLDVYSTATRNLQGEDHVARNHMLDHLKKRFAAYQRRLEKHLSNNDGNDFEECIMDFWDEFFPQTSLIQYHDRHTAVPRLSRLHKFLTRPCPKSIGTVQCEIERIKVESKKKVASMKGRFFPTYEYRLFIRHRLVDDQIGDDASEDESAPRRDTVLMMAKNRGRKPLNGSSVKSSSSSLPSSKKGSNNYFLYLPLQEDVDMHYQGINKDKSRNNPNGVRIMGEISGSSSLLCRLQSNFIGTEFQIFTPRVTTKKPESLARRSITASPPSCGALSSDDERDPCADNSMVLSSLTPKKNRFGRLSLLGRSSHNPENDSDPASTPPSLRRSRSSGDVTTQGRKSRPSHRRVSAADAVETKQGHLTDSQPYLVEEEDGAITYTANLLGSRPRIMDVCIPKLDASGRGMEWKRYLEHATDADPNTSCSNKMLNLLKQLQQRGDGDDWIGENTDNHTHLNMNNNTNMPASADIPEGRCEEYSPPSDFGLIALQNRPPWWNVELGSFVLNFGGRVSVASVKNFQLCGRNDQDYIMLQFGRITGRHSFTMDYQYPLTGVQAFAIAISSLQSKISFG